MSDDLKRRLGISESEPSDWFEPLYAQSGNDGVGIPWANMKTHPSLSAWLADNPVDGRGKSALVVGCGLGDDAIELESLGFHVTAFDVSTSAIEYCKKRFPESNVDFIPADLLMEHPEWEGKFDFILEIYTIQALPPIYESELIRSISSFLSPTGQLLVITEVTHGDRSFDKGPPWVLAPDYADRFRACGLEVAGLSVEKGTTDNDGNDIHTCEFVFPA